MYKIHLTENMKVEYVHLIYLYYLYLIKYTVIQNNVFTYTNKLIMYIYIKY